MYTTHRKSIKNRILAGVGALFLAAYAMADIFPAAAQTIQQEREYTPVPAYAPEEDAVTIEDTITETDSDFDPDSPLEEEYPYEDLSDEARQTLAEENIPLAGYEEYPAEIALSALSESVDAPMLLSSDSSGTDWDSWVKLSSEKDDENIVNKLINHFDAAYSSDMLEGDDTTHYIERSKDFTVKYTVTLNTSKELGTGNAVIRIPSALFQDRFGNPVTIRDKDGIALPKYSVNPTLSGDDDSTTIYTGGTITKSTRTQFGYYIENEGSEDETYVIVNYDKIKPGSTWFEIVYDKIAVFDVVDEQNNAGTDENPLTWSCTPEITANYMFEQERWVFTGNTPAESDDASTLKQISFNWEKYLPSGYTVADEYSSEDLLPKYSSKVLYMVFSDTEGTYFAIEPNYEVGNYEDFVDDGKFISMYLCALDDDGEPVIKYRQASVGEETYYERLQPDQSWARVNDDDAPQQGVHVATFCENDYYRIMTTRSIAGQAVQVYTYYDSEGIPQYQEQVTDGTYQYFRNVNNAWVEDSNVAGSIPAVLGDYKTFKKDSEALTGYVDTQAKLTDVKKTPGKVTQKITGDLNSESQILAQIPEAQRSSITGLDLDKNIYVLWDVTISGKDCTQPFELYMDEHISYYTQKKGLEYTYYDTESGEIITAKDENDELANTGAKIIYVGGTNTKTIANFDDDGTPAENYNGYTDSKGGTESQGYFFVGSSDPVKAEEAAKSPAELSGLTGVGNTGNFTKNVKVIVAYPRGNYPANGDETAQQAGVCVDTLVEADDGALVYIPYGTKLQGKTESYDLWKLVNENSKLDAERKVTETNGILANRDAFKDAIHEILKTELGVSDVTNISPVLQGFIDELAENLPKTDELKDILSGKLLPEVKNYILESWQAESPDANQAQIKKVCEDYENDVLEHSLGKLQLTDENGNTITLQSYNEKKIYRDVNNDVNVILKPLDEKDPNQAKSDDATHIREDKEPSVPSDVVPYKTANGGRKGWIDMYDASTDAEFGSTLSFTVNSNVISFEETHPREYAYFYDNKSYVHIITADDIVTAEPFGTANDESVLYGRSYVLTEKDYCYTSAKIIVNERVYDIVDDTSSYGATVLSDEALMNKSSSTDRDWYVYVSYGRDGNGNTVWEETPYATISMKNYLNESPADYNDNSKGANVLSLDFSQDAQKPFRIKVEHNTIDYQSLVTMELTAAIKTDSPILKKDGKIRSNIFKAGDEANAEFRSDDTQVEQFKMRLRNYMALHTEKFELADDGISSRKKILSAGNASYELLNRTLVDGNTKISDEDKLTDETGITGEAIEKPEGEIGRYSATVDVSTLEKESRAEKTSTYENDLTHGRAHITYRIAGFEGYQLDNAYKNELKNLSGYSLIPGKDRKTIYIYDLLPPGVEFEGFSGENEKPIAGFLKSTSNITNSDNWADKDKIAVSAEVISENDGEEWKAWGGSENGNGRYLVKFTLTLPYDAADYAVVNGGNWFFGCGIQFTANVSWERYTAAKNTPNLAVYVTDGETIGKHGKSSKNEGVFKDDGSDVPTASEKGYPDIYKPFKADSADTYKQNFDRNDTTPKTTYNRMYASSMDLGDIARASSTAVGKQVRADADTYALFSERTAVIKGEGYTYNINVENQAGGAVSSIILYDVLDGAGDDTNWKGIFQSIDTSMLTLNGIYPLVYCYTDDDATDTIKKEKIPKTTVEKGEAATLPDEQAWTDKGWTSYEAITDKSTIKAVALALYENTNHTIPYVLNGKNTLSYKISMKSPTGVDLKQVKYAKNQPNYCYYKVEKTLDGTWVIDDADSKYYDDPGNITVVTLGERRMLKVAKHVESNFSNTEDISGGEELAFTFRITRRMGYQDGDKFVEDDVPCANIEYRIFACTFDTATKNISHLGEEREAGIIHTTNENGEFVLHDGECAVFQYVPSTTVLKSGETNSVLQQKYDFDNYRITEMSKPFWYEFKSIDQKTNDAWYSFSDDTGVNNNKPDDTEPTDPYNDGTTVHYKQTGITLTNTYRPVIYISKDTAGVPADMPTNPNDLVADGTRTREEAFNTFDYNLWIYEYPINRLTGEYFGNDDGYTVEGDTDGDGQIEVDTDTTIKAAWLKFKEYYEALPNYITKTSETITSLEQQIESKNTGTEQDKAELQKLTAEKDAWTNLKTALEADKAVIDAHIAKQEGVDATERTAKFFAAPQEDVNGALTGDGYLMRTAANCLIMPISGYSDSSTDMSAKTFNNKISEKDTRENGAVLYTYEVGATADIYGSPADWRYWESDGEDNKTKINAAANPIPVQVRAGNVVALPIYIDGGMMYSDYAFTVENGTIKYQENVQPTYTARYCYKFQEAMDEKYWDDAAGEYRTVPTKAGTDVPDTDERSWLVQTPAENLPYQNTLGVVNENIMDYTNNYRFKDIYLQKSVEPADHVPKGDAKNSVDTTAFAYKVTRAPSGSTEFVSPPQTQLARMTWELWTRDENGKLLEKQMVGTVNNEGMLLAPVANYTGKKQLYTVKIRNAEVGYTYRLEEMMTLAELFGEETVTASAKKTELETKFPYVKYDADSNTFTYNYEEEPSKVSYPSDSKLNKAQAYTLATQELYAVDTNETSGALKIYDNDQITPALSKVDMTIDNVYKLRNLTVTKSIVAKNIDNDMSFKMRVRRKDGAEFQPTAVRFFQYVNGVKTYLTDAQVNALQKVDTYTPTVVQSAPDDYYYLEFNLKNGIYAELVDIGNEFDEFLIQEKDWENYDSDDTYIHLDPVGGTDGWSAWKTAVLGDNTTAKVLNGDEGYMVLSKTYVSDGAGDYDDYARSILENDDNKIKLTFSLCEKNGTRGFESPTEIPDDLVFIDGESVPDLSDIEIKGGQNVVINLKGLCETLDIPYDAVEYKVEETIPDNIQYFANQDNDVLYSVMQLTQSDEMEGDKDKTAVDIQNQVTKYRYVIYKRMGGNSSWTPPDKIDGKLVLGLRDGGNNNRQSGVKWIATGQEFSLEDALSENNHGTTGADGKLTVQSFTGWTNPEDGNLTYYVKVYFNENVECNLTRSDNAQVLEVRENLTESDDSWGYLIGYESYGKDDTYVSQKALEDQNQWNRKVDTIVNTVQTIDTRKVEVYKQVYNQNSLTEEDTDTEFTFTVKQWINGAYVPAPDISYTIRGVEGTFKTGSDGTFKLKHDQTAELELPLFSYWEITETGKGDYRLLVDDNGEIVYDQGEQYVLDGGLDGLAPDQTAAESYHAQRSVSGFTLNTDMDILSAIPIGDDVVISRLAYQNADFWHMGIRFIMRGRDSATGEYLNDDNLYKGIGSGNNFVGNNNGNISKIFRSGLMKQISATGYSDTSFEAVDVDRIYVYDMTQSGGKGDILWSKTADEGLVEITDINTAGKRIQIAKDNGTLPTHGYGYVNLNYCVLHTGVSANVTSIKLPEYILAEYEDGVVTKHKVVGVAQNACKFWDNRDSKTTEITIPASIQKIGNYAFYYMKNLKTINIPDDSELEYIGQYAFYKQSATAMNSNLNLPNSLVEIGTKAFCNNNQFTGDLKLPYNLVTMGNECFSPVENSNNPNYTQQFMAVTPYPQNNVFWIGSNVPNYSGTYKNPVVPIYTQFTELGDNLSGQYKMDLNWANGSKFRSRITYKTVVVGEGVTYLNNAFKNFRSTNNDYYSQEFILPKSLSKTNTDDTVNYYDLLIIQSDNISQYVGKFGNGGGKRLLAFTNLSAEEFSTQFSAATWYSKHISAGGFTLNKNSINTESTALYNNIPLKHCITDQNGKPVVFFLKDMTLEQKKAVVDTIKSYYTDYTMSIYAERVILGENILTGSTSTSPTYPHPPVHTPQTTSIYLAEALWLSEKRRTA